MRVAFIVNPTSAGGATGRRLGDLRAQAARVFGEDVRFLLTEGAGHAADLAMSVECDRLIAVGGDGTANEVVNGLARRCFSDRPIMGVLPAGTGCDLVKTIGMPSDLPAAMELLRDGPVQCSDWFKVAPETGDPKIGINVAGFGLSGAVVEAVNKSSKRLGGRASFGLATIRATVAWHNPVVEISWWGGDGEGTWTGAIASAFVANGRFCGGGMWIGPQARMNDGFLDLVIVPVMPHLRFLRYARRLYDGRITEVPGVVHHRIEGLQARGIDGEPVLVDVDGEQPGPLPLRMDVVPGAVRIVGRWRR